MTPKVSIIIAAYQAEDFLGAAIRSCLDQTLRPFEVIVVDDASPISMKETVQSAAMGDQRINFYRLQENQGPAGARNFALDQARGDYVAILDADDTFAPDRLETLLELAERTEGDIVADNVVEFITTPELDNGQPFFRMPPDSGPIRVTLADMMQFGKRNRFGNSLGYLKPMFRRSTIEGKRHRYEARLRNSEDYFFVAELLATGAQMYLTPFSGYFYRRHQRSLSHRISWEEAERVANAEVDFRKRHLDTLSEEEQILSRGREREFRRMAEFEQTVARFKSAGPLGGFAHLLENPASAPGHIYKLMRIGLQKLR